MLGVRHPSVTTVARTLQEAGIVKYRRGQIEIVDVEGLRGKCLRVLKTVKGHYQQLLSAARELAPVAHLLRGRRRS
jgi:hypothetical protein